MMSRGIELPNFLGPSRQSHSLHKFTSPYYLQIGLFPLPWLLELVQSFVEGTAISLLI